MKEFLPCAQLQKHCLARNKYSTEFSLSHNHKKTTVLFSSEADSEDCELSYLIMELDYLERTFGDPKQAV